MTKKQCPLGEARDLLADFADAIEVAQARIEELEAQHANDCEEIAKWREIVSGRTISENFEVVWRERLKRSEAKLAKAVETLEDIRRYSSCGYAGRKSVDTLAALTGDKS